MGDKNWKAFERLVGKLLFDGAKRNIGSGKINSCDDGKPRSGDVIHPIYEIECKCYKKIAIFRWWDKLTEDSDRTGKVPVLITKELGDNKDILVTIHYSLFNEMKALYEKEHGIGVDNG